MGSQQILLPDLIIDISTEEVFVTLALKLLGQTFMESIVAGLILPQFDKVLGHFSQFGWFETLLHLSELHVTLGQEIHFRMSWK